MADDNRPLKYMRYAIGEIVLVVIGILIALQINNWNEERKERKIENLILQDLKTEFKENLTDAKRVYDGNLQIFHAMEHIQKITSNQDYKNTQIDTLMYDVFDWFDYTPKPGASNNLINSGNLSIIKNRELRSLLTIWSGVVAELEDDEVLAVNYSHNHIIPFMALNYPIRNLEIFDVQESYYKNSANENIPNENNIYISYDAEELLNNPVFQNHISAKKMYARHNYIECMFVIKNCEQILELIEVELKKYSEP